MICRHFADLTMFENQFKHKFKFVRDKFGLFLLHLEWENSMKHPLFCYYNICIISQFLSWLIPFHLFLVIINLLVWTLFLVIIIFTLCKVAKLSEQITSILRKINQDFEFFKNWFNIGQFLKTCITCPIWWYLGPFCKGPDRGDTLHLFNNF